MGDAAAVENNRLVEENERLQRRIAELEAVAERFRTTLQSIGDAVISVDTSGRIAQMNPVAEALTGWVEGEALGQPLARIFRIINEDTRAEVENPVERVLREGTVVGLANHTLLVAKDGSERPIADSGAPIGNDSGQIAGVVLVFRDQTEERRAEKKIRAAEERFRSFFDNAPIGKSMTAPDGKLLRVNAAFGAMLGYSVEEMQTISFPAITHPDDLPESRECIRALLAGERDAWTMDKRYLAKDGRQVWTHVTTRLQRDDNGKPLHLLTHIEDITERKRAEEEVESLAKFPSENPNPVLRVRHDGKIIYANPASKKLLVGWSCTVGDSLPSNLRDLISTSVAENASATVEMTFAGYVFSLLFGPIPGTDYVNVYGRDITERVRAEEALRLANSELEQRIRDRTAQLEESNRELEAFSYSVSHDLRAPLRAIDGFARLLADEYADRLDAEGKRLCSVVREGAKSMGRLIDDLLAFSRLGRAEMSLSRVDMGAMAVAVFHELTTEEGRARIDFQVGTLPPAIADPTLMRQVWMNLLANAIKFSSKVKRAAIKVSARQSQGEHVFVVQDNGAGFEMKYVAKLFGVFQRLHSTREFEGTGVGLALVKRIIHRHGGRVWAEGEPDKGATFCFALQETGA